jgi:hypothetical protein
MTKEAEHPLYSAGVGYLTSKSVDEDSWAKIAAFVVGHSVEVCKQQFAEQEAMVKLDFGITSMPTAWRSAKSTALKALSHGIALTEAGGVRPKTEVAKAIAQAVKAAPVPTDPVPSALATACMAVTKAGHALGAVAGTAISEDEWKLLAALVTNLNDEFRRVTWS